MNDKTPLFIDIHALQTVPPSNMNRDDTGSPKTARFGGVVRHRVSSQAWKKAMRDAFATMLDSDKLGQRTKHATELIAEYMQSGDPQLDEDTAADLAGKALAATGIVVNNDGETGYLLFISRTQARRLASLALEAKDANRQIDKKEAKRIVNVKQCPALNAVDIALFGRMVADAPDLNVDAAVQVAHAIGIGKAEMEFDYFTALDDRQAQDQSGAAMIDTTEFLSSTLYRYATIDVNHLYENLGTTEAAKEAVTAFLKAFIVSMPTGKQNSFANRTLPSAVVVQLRHTQPVSLVNAFETPVGYKAGKSTIAQACERLVKQEEVLDAAFGVEPDKTYVIEADPGAAALDTLATCGESRPMGEVIDDLGDDVSSWLTNQASGAE